jgi:hypothetical protein
MAYETEPLTLIVDKAYKADIQFKTLTLDRYDLILGSQWLVTNKAKLDYSDKSCTFRHRAGPSPFRQRILCSSFNPPISN